MRLPPINNIAGQGNAPPAEGLFSNGTIAQIDSKLDAYMEYHFGCSMEQLLAPIGENKVGESVRHNGVYHKIKESRRVDDPTLPRGVWTHDLKVADWNDVEKTALEALCIKSKDLQLGVWIMESRINYYGFAGVAPAALLIHALCAAYWDDMHPQMQDGDIEFRTNPFNWINEKLSLRLRLIPFTNTPLDGVEFCWDDWDNAQRQEKMMRTRKRGGLGHRGPTTEAFKQRLAATDKQFLLQLRGQIQDGCRAIADLVLWLDQRCGSDSPSMAELNTLLTDVLTMTTTELTRRGVNLAGADATAEDSETGGDSNQGGGSDQGGGGSGGGSGGDSGDGGPMQDRADAFALLRQAAEFLMRDDPHSPVPYMVYTACDWGEKAAPDLYQELFLQKNGQLNIFEIMGLNIDDGVK